MALYFESRINKKRNPSDCFLAILPTGLKSKLLKLFTLRLSVLGLFLFII